MRKAPVCFPARQALGSQSSGLIDTRWLEMLFNFPLLLLLMSFRQHGSLPPTLPSPGKKKLILALFVCVSVSLFCVFSSSSWQHLRIHDVASSPRILQHHVVKNKGSACSSSYLGIITVCAMLASLSLWFLVALDYYSYFFLVCPFSCIHSSNLNYFQWGSTEWDRDIPKAKW